MLKDAGTGSSIEPLTPPSHHPPSVKRSEQQPEKVEGGTPLSVRLGLPINFMLLSFASKNGNNEQAQLKNQMGVYN